MIVVNRLKQLFVCWRGVGKRWKRYLQNKRDQRVKRRLAEVQRKLAELEQKQSKK
jgi:hypothetical protein